MMRRKSLSNRLLYSLRSYLSPVSSRYRRMAFAARLRMSAPAVNFIVARMLRAAWPSARIPGIALSAETASNVICLPLCAAITVLAALGGAVFAIWPAAASPLLYLGSWASQALLWAVDFFADLPLAQMWMPSFSALGAAAYFAGLLWFALGRGKARALCLLAPLALLVAFAPTLEPAPGLAVTFLSVGQGDAVVLSSMGRHALVDGGGTPGGADTGKKYLVPYFRAERIERLDLAVLSHPHPDHGLGLVSALRAVPASRLWLGQGTSIAELSRAVVRAAGGAAIVEVAAGHEPLALGAARIEVLGPPPGASSLETENDRSVFLQIGRAHV